VLDASEMPPTFGTFPELVCAHIAGGESALTRAIEGAEDDDRAGEEAMEHVTPSDIVIGISASGGARYVIRAIEAARGIGAYTVGICNNESAPLARAAHVGIVLRTGPEPLAGSTRLKAGTAQKIVLNAISTAVMVRLGKVYDNRMVDVVATNEKLRQRALRLVMEIASCNEERARELLNGAGGRVKVAIVMERRGLSYDDASKLLNDRGGFLRACL
jgi:N-acetylmuramic acid 6-phosphate etherase